MENISKDNRVVTPRSVFLDRFYIIIDALESSLARHSKGQILRMESTRCEVLSRKFVVGAVSERPSLAKKGVMKAGQPISIYVDPPAAFRPILPACTVGPTNFRKKCFQRVSASTT
jgi:hypothetical protein